MRAASSVGRHVRQGRKAYEGLRAGTLWLDGVRFQEAPRGSAFVTGNVMDHCGGDWRDLPPHRYDVSSTPTSYVHPGGAILLLIRHPRHPLYVQAHIFLGQNTYIVIQGFYIIIYTALAQAHFPVR